MARIARGAITIADITDGTDPVSAFLTNENHTFIANTGGEVADTVKQGFSSAVTLFIGSTKGTLITNTAAPDTKGEYRVKPFVGTSPTDTDTRLKGTTPTSSGYTPAVSNDANGIITVSDIASDSDDSVTLIVVVEYHNGVSLETLELDLTFSKVRQGAGGVVIVASPSSQYFYADNDGTLNSGQSNIRIDITTTGTTGSITLQTRTGSTWDTKTTTAATAGGIVGYATSHEGSATTGDFPDEINNGSNSTFSIFISPANLGNSNDILSFRVTSSEGGGDTVSIVKVLEGIAGQNAIVVVVESSTEGTVFRTSGTNDPKTLTARVYDMTDGSELTAGAQIYKWFKGDGSSTINVVDNTDRVVDYDDGTVNASTGTTRSNNGHFIVIDQDDVTNREQFTCEVSVADS